MIDISDIDKPALIAAMFNAAGQGEPMTRDDAATLYFTYGPKFDVLKGRTIHCDVSHDLLDPARFDALYGEGKARELIEALRPVPKVIDIYAPVVDALDEALPQVSGAAPEPAEPTERGVTTPTHLWSPFKKK